MSGIHLTAHEPTKPSPAPGYSPGYSRTPGGRERRAHGGESRDTGRVTPSERDLWMPLAKLYRYQGFKLIGSLMMSGIFLGWLVLQGSNPVMWWLCVGLIAVTLWVVLTSMVHDARRARDRQVWVIDAVMGVTTPRGAVQICLDEVAWAQWRDEVDPGLWLYNREGQPLMHLDLDCLADQAEARMFLNWARQRTDLSFKVYWPTTPG